MRLGASFTALYFTISATPNAAQHRFARRFLVSPVVGYQNKETESGYKMIGSVFYSVGDSTDQRLNITDLKIVGYLDNEVYTEDEFCEGSFGDYQIKILNSSGGDDAIYDWNHCMTDHVWDSEGTWSDTEVSFAPGQGIWFYANVWTEDVKLVSAGEPLMQARNVPVNSGYTAITIPLARQVSISEIHPSYDYMTNETYTEDEFCEGSFGDYQIKILDVNGGDSAIYDWNHVMTDSVWDPEGGAWSDEHTFEIGDAVWYYANVWEEGYTLDFPALEDDPE